MNSTADIARAFEKSAKNLKARNILLRKVLICAYRYIKENNNDLDHLTKQFGLLHSRCSLPTLENESHWQLPQGATHSIVSNKIGRRALLVPDSHPPLSDVDGDCDENPPVADVAYIADSATSSPAASSLLIASEQSTPGSSRTTLSAACTPKLGNELDTTSPVLAPLKLIDSESSIDSSPDRDCDDDPGSLRCAHHNSELPHQSTSSAARPFTRGSGADRALPTSGAMPTRRQPGLTAVVSPTCPCPGEYTLSDSAVQSCDHDATECVRDGSLVDQVAKEPIQLAASLSDSTTNADATEHLGDCVQQRRRRQRGGAGCRSACRPASRAQPATVEAVDTAGSPAGSALVVLQADDTVLHGGSQPTAGQSTLAAEAVHDAPLALSPRALPCDSALLCSGAAPCFSPAPAVAEHTSEMVCSEIISPVSKLMPIENIKLEGVTAEAGGKWTSRGKKRLRSKQSKLDSFFDHNGPSSRGGRGSAEGHAPSRGRGRHSAKMPRDAMAIGEDTKENVPPERQASCLKYKTGREKASENSADCNRFLVATCTGDADEDAFDPDETTLHLPKASAVPVTIESNHALSITAGPGSVKQCGMDTSPCATTVQKSFRAGNQQSTPPSGKVSLGTARRNGLLGRRSASREPPGKPAYAYAEVVRGKKRLQLKSYSCRQCLEYFSAMNLPEEEQKKRLDQVCRHRGQKKPPQTPTGFWDMHLDHTE